LDALLYFRYQKMSALLQPPVWYTNIVKPMRFVGGKMPLFDSWYSVIGAVVAYLVVVYSLQQWMKDRKPYSVKAFAFIHNVFLCILSAFMAAGIMFELALIAWIPAFLT